MKQKWKCCSCGKKFERWASQVRNPNAIFCSKKCRYKWQGDHQRGENNPNYRYGAKQSKCECGELKDYRALQCSKCSKRSYPKIGASSRITENELIYIIQSSFSYLEASRRAGVSRYRVKQFAEANEIDISHMVKCAHRLYKPHEVLLESSRCQRNNAVIRQVILRNQLLEYKCSNTQCQLTTEWLGGKLVLELDHINGNCVDNRIENLRFLCPNCHSQTSTYKGRNMQKRGAKSVQEKSDA